MAARITGMDMTEPRSKLAAAVLLVALTTVLPEMLSGNTPAPMLFRVEVFAFFALAYGLPVLLIREWSVRLGLSKTGIFMAGLGYGLINEGLLARTIFRETGVPIDLFDRYGMILGVNVPWAAFICAWHAMSSVLLPIMLSHLAFPAAATTPWIGGRTGWVLALVAVALASLVFLDPQPAAPAGSPVALVALWLAIALLAFAGSRFRGTMPPANSARAKPFLLGLAALPLMIAVLLAVRAHPPLPVYGAALAAAALLWTWLLARGRLGGFPAFGRVAFGWYAQMAGFGWFAMIHRSPVTIAVGASILAGLHLLCTSAERQAAS